VPLQGAPGARRPDGRTTRRTRIDMETTTFATTLLKGHAMRLRHAFSLLLLFVSAFAQAEPVKVNAFNFARAETDLYFGNLIKDAGALARFHHIRLPTPLDQQSVIRMQRDTLYSAAVFDLDAGPVTITMPPTSGRFMSLLVVDQDHYAPQVHYAPGSVTLTRQTVGTRYVATLVRTFVNATSDADIKAANALQDAIRVAQPGQGRFEIPAWDPATQDRTRELLVALAALGGADNRRFGRKEDVNPINWLLSTASGWGGNPPEAAIYLSFNPTASESAKTYTLRLKDVPVDGFWSVTVYDDRGYMFDEACSVNNVTAKREADGSVVVQLGGDRTAAANFLATRPGWNYTLRLYRPRAEIINGSWQAPQPTTAN
jgi:hypothetical protein